MLTAVVHVKNTLYLPFCSEASLVVPGVGLNLFLSNSFFRFNNEELADEVLKISRNVFPDRTGEGVLASFYDFKKFKLIVVEERYLSTSHSVQNHTQAPEVTSAVIGLLI